MSAATIRIRTVRAWWDVRCWLIGHDLVAKRSHGCGRGCCWCRRCMKTWHGQGA